MSSVRDAAMSDRQRVDQAREIHYSLAAAVADLIEHERQANKNRRPHLRLVHPRAEVVRRDPAGEGLREYIRRLGWDLFALDGETALLAAGRYVLSRFPEHRLYIGHVLFPLWSGVGRA